MNLTPKGDSFSMGAGIALHVSSGLEYDVHITIDKSYVSKNIAPYAAHLFAVIYSSCSLLVKDFISHSQTD